MRKITICSLSLIFFVTNGICGTTNKMLYGTSNQSITISASQPTNVQSVGTAIDNTSNLFLDALVSCNITSPGSGPSSSTYENFYVAGTANGGTTYSDGVGASSATVTLTNPPNLKLIGVCSMVATSTAYKCGPFSVGQAFAGILPDHWTLVIENKTGGTTSAGTCFYQGIYVQNL